MYEVGSVASDNVIAPFAFRVLKTTAELRAERDAVVRAVEPVFDFVPAALDSARQALAAFRRRSSRRRPPTPQAIVARFSAPRRAGACGSRDRRRRISPSDAATRRADAGARPRVRPMAERRRGERRRIRLRARCDRRSQPRRGAPAAVGQRRDVHDAREPRAARFIPIRVGRRRLAVHAPARDVLPSDHRREPAGDASCVARKFGARFRPRNTRCSPAKRSSGRTKSSDASRTRSCARCTTRSTASRRATRVASRRRLGPVRLPPRRAARSWRSSCSARRCTNFRWVWPSRRRAAFVVIGGAIVARLAAGASRAGARRTRGGNPQRAVRSAHQPDRGDGAGDARRRAKRVPRNERAVHQPGRRRGCRADASARFGVETSRTSGSPRSPPRTSRPPSPSA